MILGKKNQWWQYAIFIGVFLMHFTPFYILIGVALKSPADTSSRWMMPGYIHEENFITAMDKGNIQFAMLNSLVITVIGAILIILFGALAAYPLCRRRTRFNALIKAFVLGIMMVPPLSILVPLYSMMAKLSGTSTYWGIILILVTFQLPMSIFLYTNFIASIPKALDEAASIDGCGPLRTFIYIILPQLRPVTASVAILTGVNIWNDYQFSLYLLQAPKMRTVTLSIASFFSMSSSNVNAAAAAALMGIAPVIIMFLLLQKYFVKGMVDSAVK